MTVRITALGGGLLLVAALVTGCGGGTPGDASEDDFCSAYNNLYDNLGAIASGDNEKAIEGMKDWADEMADVGTPDDIPDDAREGFELLLQAIEDVDAGASAAELEQIGEDFSADQEKKIDAFGEYAITTCPMDMPEMPDMGDLEEEMGDLTESP